MLFSNVPVPGGAGVSPPEMLSLTDPVSSRPWKPCLSSQVEQTESKSRAVLK